MEWQHALLSTSDQQRSYCTAQSLQCREMCWDRRAAAGSANKGLEQGSNLSSWLRTGAGRARISGSILCSAAGSAVEAGKVQESVQVGKFCSLRGWPQQSSSACQAVSAEQHAVTVELEAVERWQQAQRLGREVLRTLNSMVHAVCHGR